MSREFDEQSADMRLVELQRRRLDVPERPPRWSQTSVALEETFSGAPRVDLEVPELSDAMIVGSLHVAPSRGLIAGALVTVTLLVENAGGAPAPVRARLALSLDAGYRPGSTRLDDREIPDFDEGSAALGEQGLDLGTLAPGDRRRLSLTAKLGLSTEPFRVTGRLEAGGAPALGMTPVEIERSREGSAFAQAVAQRLEDPEPSPYELEADEELLYEAVDAALSPQSAPVPPEPAALREPAPNPEAAAAAPAAAGAPRFVLWNTVDAAAIRFLARVLQDGSALGLLGHFLVANGLAARYPPQAAGSGDALGLAKFSAEQAALLNRLMLQARMKRTMSLDGYATPPPLEQISRIEALPALADAVVPAALPSPSSGSLVLYATLGASELAFLGRTASSEKTPAFVRNRQVTAALLPTRARGAAGERDEVSALLVAYAQASLAAITRFFVQLRLQPSLLPTTVRDAALEAAAAALIEGLTGAL